MILYTEEGGVTATIWTDAIQMFVYLAGRARLPGRRRHAPARGRRGRARGGRGRPGKLQVFDPSLDPTQPYTFWAGLIGGVFLTLATHGTDHYLVQRLLVARSRRDASIGLVLSGFLVLRPVRAVPGARDAALGVLRRAGRSRAATRCCPTFVSTELPGGWRGLHPGGDRGGRALAVAQLDGLRDRARLLPAVRAAAAPTSAQQMRVARVFTVVWGVAQIGVAVLAQGIDSALNEGLAALGYASGPTVGAFLLGVLTRSARSAPTMIGMIVGLATSLSVGMLAPFLLGRPGVAWTWNVAVGAIVTFVVGWLVSRLTRPGSAVGGKSAGSSMAGVVVGLGVLLAGSAGCRRRTGTTPIAPASAALARGDHARRGRGPAARHRAAPGAGPQRPDVRHQLRAALLPVPAPGRGPPRPGTARSGARGARALGVVGSARARRRAPSASPRALEAAVRASAARRPARHRRRRSRRLRPRPRRAAAAPTPSHSANHARSGGLANPLPAPPPATPERPRRRLERRAARVAPPRPHRGAEQRRRRASLEIISQPAGAAVYLDDEPVGSTDPQTGRLVKRAWRRDATACAWRARATRTRSATSTSLAATRDLLTPRLSPAASPPGRSRAPASWPSPCSRSRSSRLLAWLALRQPPPDRRARRAPRRPSGRHAIRRGRHPARAHEPGRETRRAGAGVVRRLSACSSCSAAAAWPRSSRPSGAARSSALKRPLASLLDDPEFLERFLREAEIGRTLNHPNIVRILERGERRRRALLHDGAAAGRDAASVPAARRGPLSRACGRASWSRSRRRSTSRTARASSTATSSRRTSCCSPTAPQGDGLRHRARRALRGLTATAAFLGTPDYVAPEMIEGAGTEPRSDLYALGVVFFELLTGAAALRGATRRSRSCRSTAPRSRRRRRRCGPACRPSSTRSCCGCCARRPTSGPPAPRSWWSRCATG